jgi:hypothetical protein
MQNVYQKVNSEELMKPNMRTPYCLKTIYSNIPIYRLINNLYNYILLFYRKRDGAAAGAWGMVNRNGNQFTVNGRPFYVNGFNTYWLMILAVDSSTRQKVSDVFQQAASVGLTVCRTWAFNDGGWRALQKSPSVYDEDVFKVCNNSTHIYIFIVCYLNI